MMQASRFFFACTLALLLAAGCSGDDTPTKTDKGTRDAGTHDLPTGVDGAGIVTQGASLSLACVEKCNPPTNTSGTVAATTLDQCSYGDTDKSLRVSFVEPNKGHIVVEIEPFTGNDTYQTTADGKIDVDVAVDGDVPSNATASGPPEQKCTIVATSNLAEITIPQTGDANLLDLVLVVTCPKLEAGATCEVECTPSPSTFQLSVKGCTVSK